MILGCSFARTHTGGIFARGGQKYHTTLGGRKKRKRLDDVIAATESFSFPFPGPGPGGPEELKFIPDYALMDLAQLAQLVEERA